MQVIADNYTIFPLSIPRQGRAAQPLQKLSFGYLHIPSLKLLLHLAIR